MATISLKLQLDKAQAAKGFDEIAKAPDKLAKAVKKSTTESKKALDDLGKTAAKSPKLAPPVSAKEVNLLKAMKKEIRDLQSAAIAAGEGTAEYARLLDLAASKQADLRDLKDVVNSLDPDVKATAFTNLASTAVGAGQGIAGAFALAGIEGEEYQKLLVRLQGIEAIGQGIKSIGALKDEWGKARIALVSYIAKFEAKIIAEKTNAALTAGSAATQAAAEKSLKDYTDSIAKATVVQRIWNAVRAASPWGLIAAGIAIATTAIAAYVSHSDAAVRAEKIRNTAADGTVFANAELRDSYNELLVAQRDFSLEMSVMTGAMTRYEAETQKITDNYNRALEESHKKVVASIEENDTWYNELALSLGYYTAKQADADVQLEYDNALVTEANKLKEEQLRIQEELNKANAQSAIDLSVEQLNTQITLMELAGQQTFDLQRDIAQKEAEAGRLRANDAVDNANQLAIVEEQLAQKLNRIDKAQADEQVRIAQESADKRLKIQEDLMSKLAALQKTIFAQDDQKGSPEVEAKKLLESNLLAIEQLGRDAKEKQRNLSAEQKKEIEDNLNALVDESYRTYYDKLTELKLEQIKKEAEIDRASFATRLERLDNSQQIELNDIELWTKEQGESEEAFIKRKEEAKLKLQLQFAQSRLAILQEQGSEANAVEVSNLQVLIKNLQDEVDKADSENKKSGREFLKKLLGVDDEGLDAAIGAFQDLLGELSSLNDQLLDQREEALNKKQEQNDRDLENNEKYLDDLNAQLKDQLAEQAAGRANNVRGIEDAIAQEQAAREQQIQEQKAIQAEQARLARQRALIESGEQLSSIISAAANIIKGFSAIPVVGLPLGIAAAALMLGSFVALKARAATATAPGFATGTKKAPSGMKWVGEEGPELINDPGGYAIMNNKDSMELMKKYQMPAVYLPDMDMDASRHIILAAKEGRNAQSVTLNQKGTEKRLDEIIELNKKPVVRSVNRKRSA